MVWVCARMPHRPELSKFPSRNFTLLHHGEPGLVRKMGKILKFHLPGHSQNAEHPGRRLGSHSANAERPGRRLGSHSANAERPERRLGSHSANTERPGRRLGSHSASAERPGRRLGSHSASAERPGRRLGSRSENGECRGGVWCHAVPPACTAPDQSPGLVPPACTAPDQGSWTGGAGGTHCGTAGRRRCVTPHPGTPCPHARRWPVP